MNKNVIAVACVTTAAAAATGIVAAAGAQEAPPTVTVSVAAKSASFQGADALKAGATRLVIKASGKGERGVALFKLRDGVTRDEITKQAPKIQNPAQAKKLGTFVASAFVAGPTAYTTTLDLQPAEYALVDFTKKPAVRGGFVVGAEQGTAVAPAPDAEVTLKDYAFSAPSTLPRDGVIRVANDGDVLHHALAFPLRKGVDTKALLKQIKAGKEPRNAFAGPPAALVEIVSPGAVNSVENKLKPGKTLLVCFIQDGAKTPPHAALGMAKVVTVR
jgi:hypothetical protein